MKKPIPASADPEKNPTKQNNEFSPRTQKAAGSGLSRHTLFEVVGTESEVCRDIEHRQQMGIAKYGTTVAGNPLPLREWLQHAYEETLDKAIYLKRAISEIDSAND